MSSNSSLWGEFEEHKKTEDLSIPLTDLEDLILPSTQPPQLYQPSQEETASFQILPTEMCQSDPVVLHTIRLLQHQRQLIQILTRAQTFGLDVNVAPPPFPEDPAVKRKAAKLHYLNFLPPADTPFVTGVNKPQKLEIESMTARLILRKAVATLCAHAGFTDSNESVLRILTDVVHDFLSKFTGLLRANMDSMMLTGNCPFHDVVEQTLQDMRLGGLADLHKMYRDRVIMYHARVKQRTLQLHHQYQALLAHIGSSTLSQSLRRESLSSIETIQLPEASPSGSSRPSTSTFTVINAQSSQEKTKSNANAEVTGVQNQTYTLVSQSQEVEKSPATSVTSSIFTTPRRLE